MALKKWDMGVERDCTPEEEEAFRVQWAEEDAKRLEEIRLYSYQKGRTKEYPSIEEQLDMIYKDKVNGTSFWENLITSIKTKYPKPGIN